MGINWGKLSQANSSFNLVKGDKRFDAWAVVQARILANGTGIGGFCGSALLCKITNEHLIFATAAHVVSKEIFYSKENNPDRVLVFLTNANGISFPIVIDNVKKYKNIDLSFIILPNSRDYNIHALSTFSEVKPSDKVYNLGFPDRAQKNDIKFSINLNPPFATFDKGPWIQKGSIIAKQFITSPNSSDVNLLDAECFRLNYASESGFSGGPLFSQDNNQVIGMMIIVVPTDDGSPPTESLALSVGEILKMLENN
jgi:hypothetical protein